MFNLSLYTMLLYLPLDKIISFVEKYLPTFSIREFLTKNNNFLAVILLYKQVYKSKIKLTKNV